MVFRLCGSKGIWESDIVAPYSLVKNTVLCVGGNGSMGHF